MTWLIAGQDKYINLSLLSREISPTLGLPTVPKNTPIPPRWGWGRGRTPRLPKHPWCRHLPWQGPAGCSSSRQRAGTGCGKQGKHRGLLGTDSP